MWQECGKNVARMCQRPILRDYAKTDIFAIGIYPDNRP